jgi:hypothetical protein
MLKLQRAGTVSTNALLGHTLYNTSKFIANFCKTFSQNMINVSRFHRRFCACHHHPSDVPSLQRTVFDAKSINTHYPQVPADTYEHSMAHYRAMRNLLPESSPSGVPAAAATWTPHEIATKRDEAGAERAAIPRVCVKRHHVPSDAWRLLSSRVAAVFKVSSIPHHADHDSEGIWTSPSHFT